MELISVYIADNWYIGPIVMIFGFAISYVANKKLCFLDDKPSLPVFKDEEELLIYDDEVMSDVALYEQHCEALSNSADTRKYLFIYTTGCALVAIGAFLFFVAYMVNYVRL